MMLNGKIREVVSGFKMMVDNIPNVYDNFDEALDKLYEGFYLTMNELLPFKYFALYEHKRGYEMAIFDNADERNSWITLIKDSGLNKGESCHKISFDKFLELAYDGWSNPNCYSDVLESILIFSP